MNEALCPESGTVSPLRILFLSAEVAPFARTGGLGDVSGALPKALVDLGHEVRIVMPLYQAIRDAGWPLTEVVSDLGVGLPSGHRRTRVWQASLPGTELAARQVPVYFLEQDDLFARPGLYGDAGGDYADNVERFTFFAYASVAMLTQLNWFPHVFHCHDWHTGLVPALLRCVPESEPRIAQAASLFTIHNLAYQGLFPATAFATTGLPSALFQPAGVEFYGSLNCMKAGLVYADWLTTVSPSHAQEIGTPEFGCGLDGVIRQRQESLSGILNGADYTVWNPETDAVLPARYSAASLGGKQTCKQALLREFELPPNEQTLLIGMVTRLVDQKGIDILRGGLEGLLEFDCQLVILGSGEAHYETWLSDQARAQPDRIGVQIGFDEALSHRIVAGSDCFLMPSRYEPCGLSQIYSLRYGTLPIVRATGGLRDTVVASAAGSERATGFVFQDPSPEALLEAVETACSVFADSPVWQRMMHTAMAQDFSWTQSAQRYSAVYHHIVSARQSGK